MSTPSPPLPPPLLRCLQTTHNRRHLAVVHNRYRHGLSSNRGAAMDGSDGGDKKNGIGQNTNSKVIEKVGEVIVSINVAKNVDQVISSLFSIAVRIFPLNPRAFTDLSCPYLDRQVSCVKSGKNDTDYRHWEWQVDNFILPRFSARLALDKIRGKRMLFVGDSLQRGQWQSFVCLVEFLIPNDCKSMRPGKVHSILKIKVSVRETPVPVKVNTNADTSAW